MSKVSVIIPCFNLGQYIDEAVDSVLSQSLRDLEIIIINDGSTDPFTLDKLKNFNNPDCIVIHTENKGLAAARNIGLRLAKGDYIQFLDADDVIDHDKFRLQIAQLRDKSDYAISCSDYFTSTENDINEPFPSRYLTPCFKTGNYLAELITDWESKLSIPCHCFLFNSKIFKDHKITFDETLPNHEDWDCWMSIFSLSPEVFYINEKLATYRIRAKSMCSNPVAMTNGFLKAIQKQKEIHKNDRGNYRLLSKRHNELKYGFSSKYKIIAFLMGVYRKEIRKVKHFFLRHLRHFNLGLLQKTVKD